MLKMEKKSESCDEFQSIVKQTWMFVATTTKNQHSATWKALLPLKKKVIQSKQQNDKKNENWKCMQNGSYENELKSKMWNEFYDGDGDNDNDCNDENMVHIGCGADVIRQRRRNEELRKEAEAQGLYVSHKDFKPAKNKKYPHFTPARDKDIFNGRKCSHMKLNQAKSSNDKLVEKVGGATGMFSRGSSIESASSESSATSSRSTG